MLTDQEVEATNSELNRVYDSIRDSYLNVLYYGKRVKSCSCWNVTCQAVAAIGSLGAVAAVLKGWEPALGWIAAVSAIAAALPLVLGLSDKVRAFEKLHFAYGQAFYLAKNVSIEIQRSGRISEEHIGAIRILSELHSRLGPLDEPSPDPRVRELCTKIVNDRFPIDRLWYASYDGTREETATATDPDSDANPSPDAAADAEPRP